MHNNAITLNNVSFSYDSIFTLRNASITIPRGACVFLLGPNGAGKTTCLKLIAGLLKPDTGTIQIDGVPLEKFSRSEIARRIALVEQDTTYLFPFTVEEIVLMGRYPHSTSGAFESSEDETKAEWAMQLTHTAQFRNRSILTLSGGERRRVEIARALAQEADILLLDEPTSHLDIKQQRELFKLLHRLHTEQGKTLFIISHHLNFIKAYSDQIYFIKDGVIEEWHEKQLLDNEEQLSQRF